MRIGIAPAYMQERNGCGAFLLRARVRCQARAVCLTRGHAIQLSQSIPCNCNGPPASLQTVPASLTRRLVTDIFRRCAFACFLVICVCARVCPPQCSGQLAEASAGFTGMYPTPATVTLSVNSTPEFGARIPCSTILRLRVFCIPSPRCDRDSSSTLQCPSVQVLGGPLMKQRSQATGSVETSNSTYKSECTSHAISRITRTRNC